VGLLIYFLNHSSIIKILFDSIMDNIHAPTVPSGPTTAPVTNGTAAHLSFAQLQQKKDDLEAELKALGGVLDSHRVTMDTPLVTRDGFPRSDIDVAQVRTTRARIIRLRNDYKELMVLIEKHLHDHFASLAENSENSVPIVNGSGSMLPDSEPETLPPTFARVNTVADDSPAYRAGLKAGDEIRTFGYVNHSNNDSLRKVAECVQGNEGSDILIKVSRALNATRREELQLTLTPTRNWGGRGMLGCHILPL
jgi:26S proteasome non-ATPase regulatory subunit 9